MSKRSVVRLSEKHRRRLQDWLVLKREKIPFLSLDEIVVMASDELGLLVTSSHVKSAITVMELPKPAKASPRRRPQVVRAGVTLAVAEAIVSLSSKLGEPIDELIVDYIAKQRAKLADDASRSRNGEAVRS